MCGRTCLLGDAATAPGSWLFAAVPASGGVAERAVCTGSAAREGSAAAGGSVTEAGSWGVPCRRTLRTQDISSAMLNAEV